ncbi:MAG: helix-turn-helix domain-containing protein [Verrucomicrobia bacterium]|nr:helix-turn-helix domain-containing protein [Verrucomicrobiota bacterium]
MTFSPQDDLFPNVQNAPARQCINARCQLRTEGGYRVVLVSGIPLAQYLVQDRMSEAHAMVSLIEQGWADQNDVARAFGYAARTLRRCQRRFEEGGLAALAQPAGYPRGRARLATSRRALVQRLKAEGHSQRQMAEQLGVSVRAVRKTLRRLGWKPAAVVQPELPLEPAAGVGVRTAALQTTGPSSSPQGTVAAAPGPSLPQAPATTRGPHLHLCPGRSGSAVAPR